MSNFGHEPAHLTPKQRLSLVLSQIYGVGKRVMNVVVLKHKRSNQ